MIFHYLSPTPDLFLPLRFNNNIYHGHPQNCKENAVKFQTTDATATATTTKSKSFRINS